VSEAHEALARLRAALAEVQLPEAVRRAWSSTPPTPLAGQLWSARWGNYAQFVLLLDVLPNAVRAVPVTFDVGTADHDAVVIHGVFPAAAVVRYADETAIPVRVLDRYTGLAVEHPRKLDGPPGEPIASVLDPRARHRARLQDALETFAHARWAPEGSGRIAELLKISVDASAIVQALQLTEREFVQLRKGNRPVTPEQAKLLAGVLDMPAEEILAANPALPDELVADLDWPQHRALVLELAERQELDEIQAWRTAGYAIYAAQHRTSGNQPPSWQQLIQRYFEAALGGH
jgi:hypothetical protein